MIAVLYLSFLTIQIMRTVSDNSFGSKNTDDVVATQAYFYTENPPTSQRLATTEILGNSTDTPMENGSNNYNFGISGGDVSRANTSESKIPDSDIYCRFHELRMERLRKQRQSHNAYNYIHYSDRSYLGEDVDPESVKTNSSESENRVKSKILMYKQLAGLCNKEENDRVKYYSGITTRRKRFENDLSVQNNSSYNIIYDEGKNVPDAHNITPHNDNTLSSKDNRAIAALDTTPNRNWSSTKQPETETCTFGTISGVQSRKESELIALEKVIADIYHIIDNYYKGKYGAYKNRTTACR
ncbi:hypothetical protein VCUG_01991 [Vavraia culicis subsp. floridensis]|uniref:Uncharacterized protein n=1 Tax=Vavraia culicis (isolate floridensis) TaxID=948595 RepID=L2GS97_VAVCU|nr:uncharacterized protein VCUG_01991 [Vavraia culicis subsp. floridensis]ELA46499.1 hypothetical protein VCUG_01991 [Vavraia culicis subsp. floridensis]